MKKNYFFGLFASLMLLLAVPANGQISSITEMFGTYKFTATMDVTDFGQDYAHLFTNECEVKITKSASGWYTGQIEGIAGSESYQDINSFDADAQTITILNPNQNGLWEGLDMTWVEGTYPYPWADTTIVAYNGIDYVYDHATKVVTMPDFAIVKSNHKEESATLVATFKNVKLTLIEAEVIEVPNIAGEWDFEPTPGYVRNDSTFTSHFVVSLAGTDDSNKTYDATITFDGFDSFTLSATFDGNMLTIPFDSTYLDADQKIFFGVASPGSEKTGAFTFQYQSSTSMMLWDRIYVRQEVVGDTATTYPMLQRLNGGYLSRPNPDAFAWDGTYKVTFANPEQDIMVMNTTVELPTEFEFTIKEAYGTYYVEEFMGNNVYYLTWGGYAVSANEDGTSATIGTGYGSDRRLSYIPDLASYLIITDVNGTADDLTLSLNEDGTLSMGDIYIAMKDSTSKVTYLVGYSRMIIEKVVEEPYDWSGTYTLTAETVDIYNGETYPKTFDVVVDYWEDLAAYYVSSFLDNSITVLNNWGCGIALSVADDAKSAALGGGGLLLTIDPGISYLKMGDMNATTSDINLVLNEDETISMDNFSLIVGPYSGSEGNQTVAYYQNVTLTKKADDETSIEQPIEETNNAVEGIYDLSGRRIDEITAPGIYIVNGKKVLVK